MKTPKTRSSRPLNDQVTPAETDILLDLARACLPLAGDWVEFGCYKGDTSILLGRLLQQHYPSTSPRLWLYDSFAGLPPKSPEDASGAGQNFQAGALTVTKHEVVTKLRRAGLQNTIIKKAWFQDLTDADLPRHIAFAFLDGDLYASIKTSLHLVTPRLVPGGYIVVHDYNNPELPGATRAVDEFLRVHHFSLQVRHSLAIMV